MLRYLTHELPLEHSYFRDATSAYACFFFMSRYVHNKSALPSRGIITRSRKISFLHHTISLPLCAYFLPGPPPSDANAHTFAHTCLFSRTLPRTLPRILPRILLVVEFCSFEESSNRISRATDDISVLSGQLGAMLLEANVRW